jgi:hypothetical protein
MGQVHHRSATTTAAIRRAIQHSQASLRSLAKRYGINPKTVAKWKRRANTADQRTGPKEPGSTVMRCTWRRLACQMRCTALRLIPTALATIRPVSGSPLSAVSRTAAPARGRWSLAETAPCPACVSCHAAICCRYRLRPIGTRASRSVRVSFKTCRRTSSGQRISCQPLSGGSDGRRKGKSRIRRCSEV